MTKTKRLSKTEIKGFDVSQSTVITQMLIKENGAFEQWDLSSRRSRAMILTRSGPSLGWKPVKCHGMNRMLDVNINPQLAKRHSATFWP